MTEKRLGNLTPDTYVKELAKLAKPTLDLYGTGKRTAKVDRVKIEVLVAAQIAAVKAGDPAETHRTMTQALNAAYALGMIREKKRQEAPKTTADVS